MKRAYISIACIFVLFTLLDLTACGTKTKVSFTPTEKFCLHMKAVKDEKEFEAEINCIAYNDITLSFSYPEELSGFSVTAKEDSYHLNIFGTQDNLSPEEISGNSLINVFFNALKISVFKNHGQFCESEEGFYANLTVNDVPITVNFNKEGLITKMTADAIGFSAEFEKSG